MDHYFDEYTEEQKAAMIYCLMLISSANGSYNNEKLDFVENQANLIELNLESQAMIVQMTNKAAFAYSIINKFTVEQKEFFSILLGSCLFVNNTNPSDNEQRMAQRILESCNITNEEYNSAISKSKAMMRKFGN